MRDDPLEDWLALGSDGLLSTEVGKLQSRMKSDLDRIVNRLDHPPEGKPRGLRSEAIRPETFKRAGGPDYARLA